MTQVEARRSPISPVLGSARTPKRIGVMVLSSDSTVEPDFALVCPAEEVAIHVTRVLFQNPATPDNLRKMQPHLAQAAGLILPDETLDAICYSCTSASMVLGDEVVASTIGSARPGIPVVTPALAGRIALDTLGCRRISIFTPYPVETNRPVIDYFTGHGFEVLNLDCLGIGHDREMARVTTEDLIAGAVAATAPEAEALFISCTALRSVEAVEEVERRIGRPVVTSNQASIWLTLRWAGIDTKIDGYGRLLHLAAKTRPS